MTNVKNLPDDIDALKALLLLSQAKITDQNSQLSTQDALIERKEDRIKRLEKLLADFKRALFGAKSEKVNPEQYELALEDIETAMATIHAEDEAIDPPKSRPAPRKSNRGRLPKHLPRIEEIIEPENTQCSCGAERHIIGEDTSERLDIIPARFRVIHCPTVHVYMHERGHPSSKVCLPILRGGHCASPGQIPLDRGRHADRSHRRQCDR